jgi:hypothetical protein
VEEVLIKDYIETYIVGSGLGVAIIAWAYSLWRNKERFIISDTRVQKHENVHYEIDIENQSKHMPLKLRTITVKYGILERTYDAVSSRVIGEDDKSTVLFYIGNKNSFIKWIEDADIMNCKNKLIVIVKTARGSGALDVTGSLKLLKTIKGLYQIRDEKWS